MAGDAVSEVDSPGKVGGSAVSIVGEAGEEASDAADGDAEGERDGVEISGGLADADVMLGEFDGDESSRKRSDDGFAAEQVGRIMKVLPSECGIFQQEEKSRSDCGPGDRGCYDRPTKRGWERILEVATEP